MSYGKLLRWYPRAWREENGEVFLGMLEDDAAARGAMRPGVAEAWSIRVHGLAERASYKVALVCALLALVSLSGPATVGLIQRLMTGDTFLSISPALLAAVLIGRAIGVTAFGVAVVVLAVRARLLNAWPAALAAAAFALSALAGSIEFASWLLPLAGAAAELPFPLNLTWPTSTALFMAGAALVFTGALRDACPVWIRLPSGIALGVLSGAAYSEIMREGSGVASLAACTLLVVALAAASGRQPGCVRSSGLDRRRSFRDPSVFGIVAASSGTIGATCLAVHHFNLAGAELWTSLILVLAVLAPLPTLFVGSALLRRRMGRVTDWATAAWVLALALIAACWTVRPLAEGYLFALVPVLAAALALFGTGLLLAADLGPPTARVVTAVAALALSGGALLGVAILQLFAITPFLCLGAGCWALWRQRTLTRNARTPASTGVRDLTA
ncbi:hypothetical protein [Pseudoclavibacter sp. AY1H1]|uniref:hypothetical protein n=1 Tax=Pseudoclavibacter sp. AY1H1 TaxID=2080584 RepID=UPI0015E3E42A|nr:hypothetical protein [Pseudoclavibacter sp. AY1H1]